MGPLSRLWKWLEGIREVPSDMTVEVPVDKFVTLVEQVILLLCQTYPSVSYTCRLNILKMITKDPRKAKVMLKENEKLQSHMIEIEKSRKKSLEVFKHVGIKKSLFWKGPLHSQNKPHDGGCCYYTGNQLIETSINMVNPKVRFSIITEGKFNIEFQQYKVSTSLEYL